MFAGWIAWLGSGCSQAPPDPYTQTNSSYDTLLVIQDGTRHLISLKTSTPDDHLLTVDPRTGERLAAVVLTCATERKHPELFAPVGTETWVRCGDREAYVVDLLTGKPAVSYDQLVSNNPDLAAGFQIRRSTNDLTVSAPIQTLAITLHDGRDAFLDLKGQLRFEEHPEQESWRPGYYCSTGLCSNTRRECLSFMKSPSGVGLQLSSHKIIGERKTEPTFIGSWPVGLLFPGLVGEPNSRCAYERDEHHLILHDSAAFDPKHTMMSLVKRTGDVVWSVPYETLGATDKVQPRRAVDAGDQILVLVGNTSHRHHLGAVFVDAKTGAVAQTHHLYGRPND